VILRRVTLLAALLVFPDQSGQTNELPERTAAVLNFSDTSVGPAQEEYGWLSKGLADMCINQLTQVPGLRLVTREHMQTLLEEADLVDSLMGADALPRDSGEWLQKYLSVDDVLFGTYTIDGGTVRLQLNLIDQESGEVLGSYVEEGAFDELLDMQGRLVQRVASRMLGHDAADGEVLELPRWSNSMEAAGNLYEGIDHFDAGRFTEAWYAFRQALEVDPNYADGRYWAARMSYYRQDYEHARLEFDRFVLGSPAHPRAGDAIMEYVHSFERLAHTPGDILDVYETLGASDWKDARVYHQADFTSSSHLSDWLRKREQQVLRYQGRLPEAFRLLEEGFDDSEPKAEDAYKRGWKNDASRLMRGIAELSEDSENRRLESIHTPFKDIVLSLEDPTAGEDLKDTDLHGAGYRWGTNHRILAPPGYAMKKVTATVMRTNDPRCDAVCRLQIRRYRYVDIDTCWTTNQEGKDHNYVFDVPLPPGCTWFYLRPEFQAKARSFTKSDCNASFDGWSIVAELEPLGEVGRIQLTVENCARFKALVDDRYARCFNGVIGGLNPGSHRITVANMWPGGWGFAPVHRDVTVVPNETASLDVALNLSDALHDQGWEDPVPVAADYPWFKHRPRRRENYFGGQPCLLQNRRDSGLVIVWSHLDDLWVATSSDGVSWNAQYSLATPANSAHTEHNPRMIQDEQGRYCLLFHSDRGGLRDYASYVTWSRDLKHWSRPIMISPITHKDHDLIQANNGEYIFIGTGEKFKVPKIKHDKDGNPTYMGTPLKKSKYGYYMLPEGSHKRRANPGPQIRRSRDFLNWGETEVIPGSSPNSFICLRQDRQGLFYLIGVSGQRPYYSVSPDLKEWSDCVYISDNEVTPRSSFSATISDDRLIVGIGGRDGHYSGSPEYEAYSTSIRGARPSWRRVNMPAGVVGPLSDMMYDRRTGKLILVWQAMDEKLNSVYPSGPVFCMKASLKRTMGE
jgi:TolB-like protein